MKQLRETMTLEERKAHFARVFPPGRVGYAGLKADLADLAAGGARREAVLWRWGQMDRMQRECGEGAFLTTSLQRFHCFHAREPTEETP